MDRSQTKKASSISMSRLRPHGARVSLNAFDEVCKYYSADGLAAPFERAGAHQAASYRRRRRARQERWKPIATVLLYSGAPGI